MLEEVGKELKDFARVVNMPSGFARGPHGLGQCDGASPVG